MKMEYQETETHKLLKAMCRGGFRWGAFYVAPSIFCRDKAPDFIWAPQAKSMHQIVGN